jgi:hypothetical protein
MFRSMVSLNRNILECFLRQNLKLCISSQSSYLSSNYLLNQKNSNQIDDLRSSIVINYQNYSVKKGR